MEGGGLADAQSGGEHHVDEVGQVAGDGFGVVGEERPEVGDLGGDEGPGGAGGCGVQGVGVADGVAVDGVVGAGESAHATEDGPNGLGDADAVGVGDCPKVAVDGADGQFGEAEFAQGRDDLPVEPVAVQAQGAGGSFNGVDLGPPCFGEHGDFGRGGESGAGDGAAAVADGFGESAFGGAFGAALSFDLPGAAVVVSVERDGAVAVADLVGADPAGGADAQLRAGHGG